jgi:hypothetical protein
LSRIVVLGEKRDLFAGTGTSDFMHPMNKWKFKAASALGLFKHRYASGVRSRAGSRTSWDDQVR